MDDPQIACTAVEGQALRKIIPAAHKVNFHHVHQPLSQSIGVGFGNPRPLPAGKALKFYAWMRIGVQWAATRLR